MALNGFLKYLVVLILAAFLCSQQLAAYEMYNRQKRVECIKEDNGDLWVGLFSGGLRRINMKTGSTEVFTEGKEIKHNEIVDIAADNRYVWISDGCGLRQYDKKNNKWQTIINGECYSKVGKVITNGEYVLLYPKLKLYDISKSSWCYSLPFSVLSAALDTDTLWYIYSKDHKNVIEKYNFRTGESGVVCGSFLSDLSENELRDGYLSRIGMVDDVQFLWVWAANELWSIDKKTNALEKVATLPKEIGYLIYFDCMGGLATTRFKSYDNYLMLGTRDFANGRPNSVVFDKRTKKAVKYFVSSSPENSQKDKLRSAPDDNAAITAKLPVEGASAYDIGEKWIWFNSSHSSIYGYNYETGKIDREFRTDHFIRRVLLRIRDGFAFGADLVYVGALILMGGE